MLKYSLLLLLSISLLDGCSSTSEIPYKSRVISKLDIVNLSVFLKELLDTIDVKLDSSYQKVEYDYWPQPMRNRLQSQILAMNLPLRPDSAYYKGMIDAEKDIGNGIFMHYTYGLDVLFNGIPIWPVFDSILTMKYAIKTNYMAGCEVNGCIKAYKEGYDKVSIPIINKFYKCDVYQSAWGEAIKCITGNYSIK